MTIQLFAGYSCESRVEQIDMEIYRKFPKF